MADTKISGLTAAGTLTGTEQLAGVQSASSVKITVDQIRQLIGVYKKTSTTRYTNATTTGTEITELSQTLTAGTYYFAFNLIVQSNTTTTGLKFGVNYTGTMTRGAFNLRFTSTGATATTGVADDDGNVNTGQTMEGFSKNTESTTAPNLGPYAGVATANANILNIVEGVIVVSDGGDLELWCAAETTGTVAVEIGSNAYIMRMD